MILAQSAKQRRSPLVFPLHIVLRQGPLRSLQQLSRCHQPPMLPYEFECINEGSLKFVTSVPSRLTNLSPVRSVEGVVLSAEGVFHSAEGIVHSSADVVRPAQGVVLSAEGVFHFAHGVFRSAEGVVRSVEGVVLSAEGVFVLQRV